MRHCNLCIGICCLLMKSMTIEMKTQLKLVKPRILWYQEMGKIKYDFLLVIDTEGLNAPELLDDKKKEQRDNELATLAVGLGHITLINLKGENISEMKDILQTEGSE